MADLIDALRGPDPGLPLTMATVVSAPTLVSDGLGNMVNTITIDVGIDFAGNAVQYPGVRYFASYAPSVGDVVWFIWNGRSPIVLGKLA